MESISIELLLLLATIAAVAGFVDVLAGGGGLLTIPALLFVGLPPLNAIATNKLQAVVGTAVSSSFLLIKGHSASRAVLYLVPVVFVASMLGAAQATQVSSEDYDLLIPCLMAAVCVVFLLPPRWTAPRRQTPFRKLLYSYIFLPLVGFYDGIFGSGAGTLYATVGRVIAGMGLSDATAAAKVVNLSSNLAALVFFAFLGGIHYPAALVMMISQALGSYVATRYIFNNNERLIRVLVVLMSFTMLITYFLKS